MSSIVGIDYNLLSAILQLYIKKKLEDFLSPIRFECSKTGLTVELPKPGRKVRQHHISFYLKRQKKLLLKMEFLLSMMFKILKTLG